MARYLGPVCRICRREGEKLYLKGERCFTSKCSYERRSYGPGQHGRGRQSFSDYKIQLRAKQKVRKTYSIIERQFRKYYEKAASLKGVTGTELLVQLETRLDNVVYRLGLGLSRRHSRQLISHGHIRVNGKEVTVASYQVGVGDIIEVDQKSKSLIIIKSAIDASLARGVPEWLSFDREQLRGTVLSLPKREQMPQNFNEQLIIELYSK